VIVGGQLGARVLHKRPRHRPVVMCSSPFFRPGNRASIGLKMTLGEHILAIKDVDVQRSLTSPMNQPAAWPIRSMGGEHRGDPLGNTHPSGCIGGGIAGLEPWRR